MKKMYSSRMMNLLAGFSTLSFCFIMNCGTLNAHESASLKSTDAFDAIAWAQADGKISLKDSVILRAKLIFAPQMKLSASEGEIIENPEAPFREPCMTSFYKDVHRVFDELSTDEKTLLSSLSEVLSGIISVRQSEAEGLKLGKSALPNFPQLDKTVEGKSCIIHYSLNAVNDKVPDQKYADLIKIYIDMAIKNEAKKKIPRGPA